MFSFVKALQNFLANLKKKKGLWFTLLTTLSIVGIALSMYLLNNMTTNIAKDVYANMSNTYLKTLDNEISDRRKELKKVAVGLKLNQVFRDNLSNPTEMNKLMADYNNYLQASGYPDIKVYFYSTINQINQYRTSINNTISRGESAFGYEVASDGPSLVYLEPIRTEDDIMGILEIRENLFSVKSDMERNSSIFLLLLEDKMLPSLSIDAREGRYRNVINDLRVEEARYDGQFYGSIISGGTELFDEMKKVGYLIDNEYFKTSKQITDINGVTIGYVVLGEKVEGSGAFVNIVDNMTKTVTVVALGLVISILLFMF